MTSLIEKRTKRTKNDKKYPEIKKVKYLKETERNDKGFGEMDSNYKRVK